MESCLNKAEITQEEFYSLPTNQKLFILENKHIFYNVNGGVILNLSHVKYKHMAKMLRVKINNERLR